MPGTKEIIEDLEMLRNPDVDRVIHLYRTYIGCSFVWADIDPKTSDDYVSKASMVVTALRDLHKKLVFVEEG